MGRVLGLVCAVLLGLGGVAVSAEGEEQVLYVYSWENYFSADVVREFEQRHNCRVDFDYFDSYDTMYERIRHGQTGYDIITPPANIAEEMERQGLLMHLNRRLIPNMRHLDTTRLIPFPDLEMRYHAPYTWSINVIGYNRNKVNDAYLGSWDLYNRDGFSQRSSMMNDPRYVIGAALKYLGFSLNTHEEAEIAEAGKVLGAWKRNIAVFDAHNARFALNMGRLDFIQAFSGDMAQATLEHPNLSFFVPREGSIINSDYFVIPVDAESHQLAHAFINHMFDPRMAARNMESIMYYMPNRAALAQLKPEFKNNPLLFVPEDDIKRSEAIRDVGESLSLYENVWESLLMQD